MVCSTYSLAWLLYLFKENQDTEYGENTIEVDSRCPDLTVWTFALLGLPIWNTQKVIQVSLIKTDLKLLSVWCAKGS